MDPSFKRYIWILWIGLIGIISFFVLLVFLIQIGIFGALPSFQEIENPTSNLASEVISEDGITLGTYFFENRTKSDYKYIIFKKYT